MKSKKVTKKELQDIRDNQDNISKLLSNVGKLEFQKNLTLVELEKINTKMENLKVKLEKKYGSVNIDLETGNITPLEEKNAA
jgi:predicted transcriptional regulator